MTATDLETLDMTSAAPAMAAATREYLARTPAMVIGGRDTQGITGRLSTVYNPADGSVLAMAPAAGAADIDAAVGAARAALDGPWGAMRPSERERALLTLADMVAADEDLLAEVETLNNGQSIAIARLLEVGASVDYLRYMAGWATKIEGSTFDVSIPAPPGVRYRAMTRKEPVGVVGAITPWNFPLLMAVWKLAPALAAGCTVVLKPAEETPLTALRLGALAREAGLPDGVINVVSGSGLEAGAALAAHPGVDKLAFTGSTPVGKIVGHAAVENMTRFTLELGGKSPIVMFQDMDAGLIAAAAQFGVFFNQGQVCTCGSRLYVQRPIFDKVVEVFASVASSLKVGPGLDPTNQVNPLVSLKQQQRVLGMIEAGTRAGGRILTGGEAVGGNGYFVQPTVVVGANRTNPLSREEVFGPVVVATPFTDFDEVVTLANDTPYGLAASIWSRDLGKVFAFADRVKAGNVWANTHNVVDPNMPFGGYKQSGIGREHGRLGVENYLESKSICIAY